MEFKNDTATAPRLLLPPPPPPPPLLLLPPPPLPDFNRLHADSSLRQITPCSPFIASILLQCTRPLFNQ
jgi:hypothetical protein